MTNLVYFANGTGFDGMETSQYPTDGSQMGEEPIETDKEQHGLEVQLTALKDGLYRSPEGSDLGIKESPVLTQCRSYEYHNPEPPGHH